MGSVSYYPPDIASSEAHPREFRLPPSTPDAVWNARRIELEAELGEEITVDGLTATWKIFQRRRGHRHSTDDVVTAFYALDILEEPPTATLDLGTGIGGVGLLVLSGMPRGHLVCVEAQAVSYQFLNENIRANGLSSRVKAIFGDLREIRLVERFALVTGSPPYFNVTAGIVPADAQKAHARFELRGDIRDYARAAARHLTEEGFFVFCFPYAQKDRALTSVCGEGFSVERVRDVIPREGLAPLFSVFACRLPSQGRGETMRIDPPLIVRDPQGHHTHAMKQVRARFGW